MFKFLSVIFSKAKFPLLSSALRMIILSLLCMSVLSACQNIPGLRKPISRETKYIPQDSSTQTNKQEEPTPIEQKNTTGIIGSANPIKIALLVPLSGTYKELGQGLLDSAQLAIFKIGDENLTLMPIDTKDSPFGAVEAAKKAVSGGAKIILGPVFSNSAKAVAKIAADNNIQVVSFSNDKSLAGSGVFAIGFLPEQQIKRIMNYSISKGIKDFVTLLPGDSYGAVVTKELRQIVANNQGASVFKSEEYQVDSKGKGISLEEHTRTAIDAALKSGSLQKAMLIPAGNNAMEMAGSFAKNNFDKSKIQLLISEQLDDTAIRNQAFDGAWFAASSREHRSDFENKFRSVYGHEAPKLSGLAYDGIALVETIVRISGSDNFTKQALTNPRGFVGVDGIFRLREDGLAERGFAVMAVRNGQAVTIEKAPNSF